MSLVYRGVFCLVVVLYATSAFAATIDQPVCVTNSSTWTLIGSSGGPCGVATSLGDPLLPVTYINPEVLGAADVPDVVGDWSFNRIFTANQYFTILEADGASVSDYITVTANDTMMSGGHVQFYSDTTPPGTSFMFAGAICTQSPQNGCTGAFNLVTNVGEVIKVTAGSDDNGGTFDPFNSGMNTSDGIRFENAVPEPTTLAIFAIGLAGVAALRRSLNSHDLRSPAGKWSAQRIWMGTDMRISSGSRTVATLQASGTWAVQTEAPCCPLSISARP